MKSLDGLMTQSNSKTRAPSDAVFESLLQALSLWQWARNYILTKPEPYTVEQIVGHYLGCCDWTTETILILEKEIFL